MKRSGRRLTLLAAALGMASLIAWGLTPTPIEVDLAPVVRGKIRETVDQDGKTRIREKYVVSAPLAGRLRRIELDPGDPVIAGETVLARIEPRDPELLDPRAVREAEANVSAAESKLKRMTPILEEALAGQEYAEAELLRAREANRKNPRAVTKSDVENRLLAYRRQSAVVNQARYGEEIARFELDLARAALSRSRPEQEVEQGNSTVSDRPSFTIHAPTDGRVLRVIQESGGVVQAGEPLLELGDLRELEVEVDVLSRDAVRVEPGAEVLLQHWGGEETLHGRVRLVEPSAFTKISTLGVEEQRVNVIVDLTDPPEVRAALGDGFRVEARIVVAEAARVLTIPTSALFRAERQWAVFRVEDGTVEQRLVRLGIRNGLEAEVVDGLVETDFVVVHPGDNVTEGVSVTQR
ncbi:MAG: HlyD family efflux transporter periplasmic adaptor subunit [Planctomycetota bacterium]